LLPRREPLLELQGDDPLVVQPSRERLETALRNAIPKVPERLDIENAR
jgi:hypothetical protein